jgi:hypothetical protein
MTSPDFSRFLAGGVLSVPLAAWYDMKDRQKLAEIKADPVAYAMRQKQQLIQTQAEITADPMLYAARQQPSEINLAFYLTYPAVLIVLFLFIGAIELVALVLRLSLLRKS